MNKRSWFRLYLAAILSFFLSQFYLFPQTHAQQRPTNAAVILILDNSGSMEMNDPDGLRFTGAKLFVSLLDEGDAAAVIRFSTESTPLTEGFITIHGPQEKEQILSHLDAVPAEGWTDMKAAFEDARRILLNQPLTGYEPVIVFLTDGKPEVPDQPKGYEDQALAVARSLGVPIMAIALTQEAESPFLNRIVQATGGEVIPANEATALLDAYLSILGKLKDRTVVGHGTTRAPGRVILEIDRGLAPYVNKASFIVSKPAGARAVLYAPNGRRLAENDPEVVFALTDDPRFLVYTVERPAGGKWVFDIQGQGSVQARAILHSRLRVEIVQPRAYHEMGQPMPIVAHIIEEKPDGRIVRIIGEASFTAHIRRPDGSEDSLDRFYDDGTHGDERSGDGDFSRVYVNTEIAGIYEITIKGYKGTVPVERTVRVSVIPFPEIVIDEPSQDRYESRGEPIPIRVHLEGGVPAMLDQGQLVAIVHSPSGTTEEISLSPEGNSFVASFVPKDEGTYRIEIVARDATYKGLPYTHVGRRAIKVRIVPLVRVLTDKVDLGTIEVLGEGSKEQVEIPFTLEVMLKGKQAETVQVNLEGMPDFQLKGGEKVTLNPGQSTVKLTLVAPSGIRPGTYQGRLVVKVPEGADLEKSPVPLQVKVVRPIVYVTVSQEEPTTLTGCPSVRGTIVPLIIRNEGLHTEKLELAIDAAESLSLSPTEVEAPPGEISVTLTITPVVGLSPGKYTAHLILSARPGVQIVPSEQVAWTYVVPGLPQRCRKQGIIGALLLGVVLIVGIKVVRGILTATRPPEIEGVLRYWPKGAKHRYTDVNLSEKRKQVITVGSGAECDVVIPNLESEHFRLEAEKSNEGVTVYLVPLGKVGRGLSSIASPITLKHKERFEAGPYEFQYLSTE